MPCIQMAAVFSYYKGIKVIAVKSSPLFYVLFLVLWGRGEREIERVDSRHLGGFSATAPGEGFP